MKFARAIGKNQAARCRRQRGFTLAEVLAAMLFMAIVVPVAVEAFRVAGLAGEISVRRAEATRVADRILNENIVTTNWTQASLSGTTVENGQEYRWTLKNQLWPTDSTLQLLTAEVAFSAAGRDYSIRLNTLAHAPSLGMDSL
jgi:prepilin-type N-terminal cleavage/methylation domain-containing protein